MEELKLCDAKATFGIKKEKGKRKKERGERKEDISSDKTLDSQQK